MIKRFFKKLIEKILSEGIDADVKINGTIKATGEIYAYNEYGKVKP